MPTLAASSSLFQFALGANAVMPALLSDFRNRKEEAAEMVLRRLRELRPDLAIGEHSKPDFVEFAFKSSAGLRHANQVNRFVTVLSLVMCALSLYGLCLSAIDPYRSIATGHLLIFVGIAIVFAPSVYFIRNRYFAWLYRTLTVHGLRSDREALVYAHCAEIYIEFQEKFRQSDQAMTEAMAGYHGLIWSMRMARVRMALHPFVHCIRSFFSRKRRSMQNGSDS